MPSSIYRREEVIAVIIARLCYLLIVTRIANQLHTRMFEAHTCIYIKCAQRQISGYIGRSYQVAPLIIITQLRIINQVKTRIAIVSFGKKLRREIKILKSLWQSIIYWIPLIDKTARTIVTRTIFSISSCEQLRLKATSY